MSHKVLKRNFPVIERECSQCGAMMRSTGQLVYGPVGWSIVFLCSAENAYVPMQRPEDRQLLDRETDGVDQSSRSGPQPIPILVEPVGVPPRFLAVVSMEGRPPRGVIPPVETLGEFRPVDGKPDLSEVSFVSNEEFVAFLHETIAQRGAAVPGIVRAASIQAEGWLYILDGRTPTPRGEVPRRDIVSAFEVREGKIVPGSYWRNPEHLLYSNSGFFMLETGLRECVLKELATRRALVEMHAARWTLRGYDSFAHENYPLPGAFETEDDAIAAARGHLAELEKAQPSASSRGQDGIQDRVFVIRPDGSVFRVAG